MATEKTYNGDGSDTTFDITFPYLTHADIAVSVGGVTKTVGSDYSITGNTVTFTTAPVSGTANVKLYRNTNIDTPEHEYSAGSSITAARLNENQKQALYAIEEAKLVTTTSGGITTGNKNDITVNSDTDWVIRANAVEKSMMADNSVGTDEIETNAVTAAELADNAVDTAAIADNAVTMAKLNSGALPTDITVASANLVDSTIATADIANSQITLAKLAAAVANSLNPVGTVIWYSGSTAPAGYLKANGDTIANGSGTTQSITADFSALYAIVGANLPDLRGEFIRGYDDGKGTDSGRQIRSSQAEENKEHDHFLFTNAQQGGAGTGSSETISEWANRTPSVDATEYHAQESGSPESNANYEYTICVLPNESNIVKSGKSGSESRPRNIALLACIKY
tara:strand:- start:13065 stop:14255 length:1191 start_codon:yes stop_codon:yes gene_type:complete